MAGAFAVADATAAAAVGVGLIGEAPAFQACLALLEKYGGCEAPVLIVGETGTGKELFARALHYLGRRRGQPFVPVNCAALQDTLLESELFGHAKGAFTDAKAAQPGLVRLAEGGTLFLDEIDSLTAKAQASLLRFLQDRQYRPVGGREQEAADLRIVAASNAELDKRVADGGFRRDLFFRLDVLRLTLPALADRREDVLLLARHFLARFAALYGRPPCCLSPEAVAWLLAQAWPGNVRELEHRLHRASILASPGEPIEPALLDAMPSTLPKPKDDCQVGLKTARAHEIARFEYGYLKELLIATNGNVSEAARRAGTERRTMGRLLKRHSISSSDESIG